MRTHYCGHLNKSLAGQTVELCVVGLVSAGQGVKKSVQCEHVPNPAAVGFLGLGHPSVLHHLVKF